MTSYLMVKFSNSYTENFPSYTEESASYAKTTERSFSIISNRRCKIPKSNFDLRLQLVFYFLSSVVPKLNEPRTGFSVAELNLFKFIWFSCFSSIQNRNGRIKSAQKQIMKCIKQFLIYQFLSILKFGQVHIIFQQLSCLQ